MSWFGHVSQGSHRQPADDHSDLRSPPGGSPAAATPRWTGGGPIPSPSDFPSAPQGAGAPLSLEELSCCSPGAGKARDPEPISYVSVQEQRCVLSWFQGWSAAQRERFLQDLLGKAVPGKVCTLLDSLSTLQVQAFPFFIFATISSMLCHSCHISVYFLFLTRLKTDYQIFLSASCACGHSGLRPGGKRRGITSCTCWRSGTLSLLPTFTGV